MNTISYWITSLVNQEILRLIKATLIYNNNIGVRAVLVELLNYIVPREGTTIAIAYQVYYNILLEAYKGSTNYQKQYNKQRNALISTQVYNLLET